MFCGLGFQLPLTFLWVLKMTKRGGSVLETSFLGRPAALQSVKRTVSSSRGFKILGVLSHCTRAHPPFSATGGVVRTLWLESVICVKSSAAAGQDSFKSLCASCVARQPSPNDRLPSAPQRPSFSTAANGSSPLPPFSATFPGKEVHKYVLAGLLRLIVSLLGLELGCTSLI